LSPACRTASASSAPPALRSASTPTRRAAATNPSRSAPDGRRLSSATTSGSDTRTAISISPLSLWCRPEPSASADAGGTSISRFTTSWAMRITARCTAPV
jgi:hypothetical protein